MEIKEKEKSISHYQILLCVTIVIKYTSGEWQRRKVAKEDRKEGITRGGILQEEIKIEGDSGDGRRNRRGGGEK